MRRWMVIFMALALSLTLIFGACAPTPAPAPAPAPKPAPAPAPKPTPAPVSAADFFKDNTVTLIPTYGAGGGTDFAARLFASYWSEVTDGVMVVKNKSGAGGLLGANYVYAAEPDGLTIGITEYGAVLTGPTIFEEPGVEFDIMKLSYIGFMCEDPYGLVVALDSPYNSIEDLQKVDGVKFSSSARRAGATLGGALACDIFGLKDGIVVTGYPGSTDMLLAVVRGEVDAVVINSAVIRSQVDKGFAKLPLVMINDKRSDWFPDTPAITELAELTPIQEKGLMMFKAIKGGKPIFAPPGVPEDRLQFMRDAFDQIMTNEAFLRQAKLRWVVWAEPTSGEEIAAEIAKLMEISKEDIAKIDTEFFDKYAQ